MQFVLSTPVVLWAGWPFFVRGWQSLVNRTPQHVYAHRDGRRRGLALQRGRDGRARQCFRRPSQHHGKIGVYFEAAAVIIVLVLLGQVLELRARSRTGTRSARCSISRRQPRMSVRDGEEQEVPLEEVQRGDQLRVRPGEKVPVDGRVIEGQHERR